MRDLVRAGVVIETPPDVRRTRIMIADDHPIVRRGLRETLEMDGGFEVVAEAVSAEEVLTQASRTRCDALVLDLSMPGAVGLSTLQQFRRQFPDIPVLILSVAPEDQFALRALRAGAAGYITKRSASAQLVAAIRRVVSGGIYVSGTAGLALVEALRPLPGRDVIVGKLSTRELEVLRLFATGRTPTGIGIDLGISVKTVSTHRKRILTKLALDSTAGLIRCALEAKLLED